MPSIRLAVAVAGMNLSRRWDTRILTSCLWLVIRGLPDFGRSLTSPICRKRLQSLEIVDWLQFRRLATSDWVSPAASIPIARFLTDWSSLDIFYGDSFKATFSFYSLSRYWLPIKLKLKHVSAHVVSARWKVGLLHLGIYLVPWKWTDEKFSSQHTERILWNKLTYHINC